MRPLLPALLLLLALPAFQAGAQTTAGATAETPPRSWLLEWPATDFSRAAVPFAEILSGGPPKDGIPSIDEPRFVPVADERELEPAEPVIGLFLDGEARAYPLRILTWHEIVNDEVAGRPVAVTYCPLCNAALVFDRTLEDGRVLDFGTTGKLRHSDLVMYDRTTESWWQQFTGEAVVGELTGTLLEMLPARLESWERFAERHPEGLVLVPNDPRARPYGRNPYVGYDSAPAPFLYRGDLPEGIAPMVYVVAVGDQAWPLERLRRAGRIESGDLVLEWSAGKASALDSDRISEGRDLGNVVAWREGPEGREEAVYDLTFAFAFHAFRPEGRLHLE